MPSGIPTKLIRVQPPHLLSSLPNALVYYSLIDISEKKTTLFSAAEENNSVKPRVQCNIPSTSVLLFLLAVLVVLLGGWVGGGPL